MFHYGTNFVKNLYFCAITPVRLMSVYTILLTLALIVSSPSAEPASIPDGNPALDALYVDAVQLYSERNYEKARPLFEAIVGKDTSRDGAWYYLGLCYAFEGKTDAAIKCLKNSITLDGGNYWYRNALAAVYRTLGEEELLISTYEDIVKDFPEKPDAFFDLLALYMKKERYDDALLALDEIESRNGPTDESTRTRYDLLRRKGETDAALKILTDYNEKFSSPSVLALTGEYYLEDYEDSLALARFNEALELDADYVPALLGRAEAYRTARRYKDYFDAIGDFMDRENVPPSIKGAYMKNVTRSLDPKFIRTHLEEFDTVTQKSLAAHPADSSVLSVAAIYYYASDRKEKALELIKKAADAYPDNPRFTANRIQLLSEAGRWEEARAVADSAYRHFHEVAFLEFSNSASYQLKDFDAIIRNCENLLLLRKDSDEIRTGCYSIIGDAYYQKGDWRNAFKAYDKALKINPDYVPVLNNYAYYLSIRGTKLKKAYSMSKKTVEAEPDNATYLDTFAWILHLQGKNLEAKPVLKHAMLYGGKESAVILDHYAEVLFALGEKDLAEVYWNMAKNRNRGGEIPDLDERIAKRLGK